MTKLKHVSLMIHVYIVFKIIYLINILSFFHHLNYLLNGSINLISNLVSGIFNVFTALIFAVYMLSQKESILDSLKELLYGSLYSGRIFFH